jgi:hypothetical protein
MPFLDPSQPNLNLSGKISTDNIPKLSDAATKFGYVPDIERLVPGDLFLSSRTTLVSKAIAAAQSQTAPSSSEWTHAAVYLGDWMLIEAVPFGQVRKVHLRSYLPDHKMLFRRANAFDEMEDAELQIIGTEIALEAALHVSNHRYAYFKALGIAHPFFEWIDKRLNSIFPNRKDTEDICSSLYAKCVLEKAKIALIDEEALFASETITPAQLAETDKMHDIDIGWLEVTENNST